MCTSKIYMPNSLRICIDKMDENEIAGRFYSPLKKESIEFNDFIEMITKADKVFDEKGYPQAFQCKRSFKGEECHPSFCMKPEILRETDQIVNQKGTIASYDILVISRRQTNWQGILQDTEGKKLGEFRGILELLKLIIA